MTSPGLDITQLLANLRKKSLEGQGTPPDQDKPPMDQNKLMSIIAGGIPGSPQPQPTGPPPGANLQQITGGNLGTRPPGQATLDFQKMIGQEPMRTDPNLQPSGKRKFGAVMAALGSGILNRNIGPAMDTYRTVRNAPFNEAERNYQQKLGNLAKSADVEQAMDEAQRKEALKGAQVSELGARRGAEEERAGAERARRIAEEQKSSPDFIKGQREFELEKERIAHPGKSEKPETFTALEAAVRARASELGVDVEHLPSTEILKINKDIESQKGQTKTPDLETRWADAFEKEHGRPPNSSEIANFHRQPKEDTGVQDRRLDSTKTRLRRPHDKAFTDASLQLDKIDEANGMLTGTTAESAALVIPKVLTAVVSGQGSGVRITQPEMDSIAKARGISGNLQGWLQQLQGLPKLVPEQINQLKQVLADVRAIVSRKQKAADEALDNIENAASIDEAAKADSKARKTYEGQSAQQGGGENKIRVRRKSDGQTGNLLEKDFDPSKYDKI